MEKMPQNRVLLYIIGCSLLPILFVLFRFYNEKSTLNELESRITSLQQSAFIRDRKQANNLLVRSYYQDADRFYIDKQIESMPLLEAETQALQKLSGISYMAEDPRISRRLNAIANDKLIFSQGMVQSYPYFNEVPESLSHPVEVDVHDLRALLAKIEGVKIDAIEPQSNRPQLIITDFRLERKGGEGENETYTLNLKLIKREYF